MIPLIRNQESDPKLNKTGTNAVEAAKNKEQTNEPEVANGSELTLLDLISKMQEKLISSNSTNVKTPAQHILSNLTPVIKRKHSHLLIQSLISKNSKKIFLFKHIILRRLPKTTLTLIICMRTLVIICGNLILSKLSSDCLLTAM